MSDQILVTQIKEILQINLVNCRIPIKVEELSKYKTHIKYKYYTICPGTLLREIIVRCKSKFKKFYIIQIQRNNEYLLNLKNNNKYKFPFKKDKYVLSYKTRTDLGYNLYNKKHFLALNQVILDEKHILYRHYVNTSLCERMLLFKQNKLDKIEFIKYLMHKYLSNLTFGLIKFIDNQNQIFSSIINSNDLIDMNKINRQLFIKTDKLYLVETNKYDLYDISINQWISNFIDKNELNELNEQVNDTQNFDQSSNFNSNNGLRLSDSIIHSNQTTIVNNQIPHSYSYDNLNINSYHYQAVECHNYSPSFNNYLPSSSSSSPSPPSPTSPRISPPNYPNRNSSPVNNIYSPNPYNPKVPLFVPPNSPLLNKKNIKNENKNETKKEKSKKKIIKKEKEEQLKEEQNNEELKKEEHIKEMLFCPNKEYCNIYFKKMKFDTTDTSYKIINMITSNKTKNIYIKSYNNINEYLKQGILICGIFNKKTFKHWFIPTVQFILFYNFIINKTIVDLNELKKDPYFDTLYFKIASIIRNYHNNNRFPHDVYGNEEQTIHRILMLFH